MSIYTTASVSGANATPYIFKERGLNNEMPITISEAPIYAIPHENIGNDSALLWANLHDVVLANQMGSVTASTPMRNVIQFFHAPIAPPLMAIQRGKKGIALKEEVVSQMRGYGMDRSSQNSGEYFLGRPDLDTFRTMMGEMGFEWMNYAPTGNVAPAGFLAFHVAWKCIGIACVVLGRKQRGDDEILMKVKKNGCKIRKIGEDITVHGGTQRIPSATALSMEVDGEEEVLIQLSGMKYLNRPVEGDVVKRKFSETSAFQPGGKGFVFPYFHGLLQPSKEYLSTVFFQNFSRCVADTPSTAALLYPTLRKGLRNLSYTREGQELQHAFFGIELARVGNFRLVPIVEAGKYFGFVLLGEGSTIMDKATVSHPMETVDLHEKIAELNGQVSVLRELAELISGIEMKKGGFEAVSPDFIGGYRDIHRLLVQRQFRESDARQDVLTKLELLVFDQQFWKVTPENVQLALESIARGSWTDFNAPMTVLYGSIGVAGIEYEALSVFGEKSISFKCGDWVVNIGKGESDPLLARKPDGNRVMPYLPYKIKGLGTAVEDMKSIMSNAQLRFPPARVNNREYVNRSKVDGIIPDPDFAKVYAELQRVCHKNRPETASSSKRKRDDDKTEGGKGKKVDTGKGKAKDLFAMQW